MKKKVVVGDAFDSMDAKIVTASDTSGEIEAKAKAKEGSVKANLAYGAIAGGGVFLMGAAGIGLYDGSFDELRSVWLAFGPVAGGIFGYYFGGTGTKNDGNAEKNG
ncbi:MAG: hypothetical protein QNJ03_04945 [Dinoroseobacter sp.]|nr:hypothetical protein [Dinoroseobacter sp.]